jgi:hypothetical protein
MFEAIPEAGDHPRLIELAGAIDVFAIETVRAQPRLLQQLGEARARPRSCARPRPRWPPRRPRPGGSGACADEAVRAGGSGPRAGGSGRAAAADSVLPSACMRR